VDKALKEAADLQKARRWNDALTRLSKAEAAAKVLDASTQRAVADLAERIKREQQEVADSETRTQKIDQNLAEGLRLLEEKPTEAMNRFDDVLALDPKNARALDGKRQANARIMASTTRQQRAELFRSGKELFDANQYEQALAPLTEAAVDIPDAADLLTRLRRILDGLKRQKDTQATVERLFAQGEADIAAGRFAEAQVAFDAILRKDPQHVKAKDRLAFAVQKNQDAVFARWMRDDPPNLGFFMPDISEVDDPTVTVRGFASDDRGIQRVEFTLDGKPVTEFRPPPSLETGEYQRQVPVEREFALAPGRNEIVVTAYDQAGLLRSQTFVVTRKLRFYETRAFWPSAFGSAIGLIGLGLVAQRVRRRRAVRRRFNPYIAGAPVLDDEMFFGRQKLMARMLNVLHHNSLMITGERRIGKTTFLYHLKKALETDAGSEFQFFPVFTDLQGVPENTFFHAVMSDVAEGLRLSPESLAALRLRPDPQGYEGRDFSHDLQRVIEELKTRTPKRVKLALLIDEVDVLNEYSERINQRLRSIFMKTFSENLVAVMSGVGIRRSWKSEGSPWYNFFDEIEITALSPEEAEALVKDPVAGFFRWTPEAVAAILEESQRKPYLIQKFCIHAVNKILEEGRTLVTLKDVEAVRQDVLFEGRAAEDESARADTPRRLKAVAD
jgi:hypothetical protein